MASTQTTFTIRYRIKNKRAVRALSRAHELLADLEADFPYRPEVKQARHALRYAAKNLTVEHV